MASLSLSLLATKIVCAGGRERRQKHYFLINQLALIEMVYLFCQLTHQVYDGVLQSGEAYDLEMRILHLRRGDHNFYLEAGAIDRYGSRGGTVAPAESKTVRVEAHYGIDTPGRAAFLIVAELYAWMGFEEERIPYTIELESVRSINPDQIVEAGQ